MSVEDLLNLSLEELSCVKVVSASLHLQDLREVPSTVQVITSDQIRLRGYIKLEDVLKDLPGFQFRNIVGFNSYSFLRGIPNQNNLILVLVDGIQINELNSGGYYGGYQYNLSNVERIEIVYGPVSALYGTNAISGIINIITKSPRDTEPFTASFTYGGFSTMKLDAGYSWYDDENDIGFRLSVMGVTTEKADLAGSAGDDYWTDDMENFEDDIGFDFQAVFENVTMGIVFQDKQASRSTNYQSSYNEYRDHGTLWHIRFMNIWLRHEYAVSPRTTIFSQAYYRNATVMDNTIGRIEIWNDQQVGYYRPNYLFGLEGRVIHQIVPELSLIAGVMCEEEFLSDGFSYSYSDSVNEEPPTPEEPDMLEQTLVSSYTQFQYNPFQNLQFTAGARFDNSDVYDKVFTPRISAVWLNDRYLCRVSYAEAFRAPKPWDYTWGDGNPDLESERMRSLEVSFQYQVLLHMEFGVSFYHNRLSNLLVQEGWNTRWINQGEVTTDGFELGFTGLSDEIYPYIYYTYLNSVNENDSELWEIAEHSIAFGLDIELTQRLFGHIGSNYGGQKGKPGFSIYGDRYLESYLVTDIALTYSLMHDVDVQLAVRNLSNERYYHTSISQVGKYRQPQRTILGRVTYTFRQ